MMLSQIGLDDIGVGADGGRRAFRDLGAEFQHHDAVRNVHHKAHVVFDQKHRHALGPQLAQQRGQLLLLHVTQTCGRLVEQQQSRIDAQRAGDLNDALLAERQAARKLMHLIGQADALDPQGGFGQQRAASSCDRAGACWRWRRNGRADARRSRRSPARSCQARA
jgi:hypothetical protein